MKILRGVLSFFDSKKERINSFLPVFLASYLVLLILPYVFGRVEVINTFFTTGWSQMIYRLLSMLYCFLYLLLVGIVNRIKIKLYYIVPASILLILFLISSIIGPRSIYFPDGSLLITVPVRWYIYDYVKFFLAIAIFLFMMNFIHPIMKSLKVFHLSLYILIGITLFSVLMSFILEMNDIVALLNGADGHSIAIHSIYQSKNTYGLFLFMASLASAFLVFTNEDDNRYMLFIIPLLIFTVMAVLTRCRTASLCCFALIIYLLIDILIMLYPLSKKTFYITISTIVVLALLFILYVSIPAFHTGSLSGLYKILEYGYNGIVDTIKGRATIWSSVGEFMHGHYFWLGANFTNSQYLLGAYNGYYRDFHSGYLKWYASTGIFGTIIYASLFIYIFYLIYKAIRRHPKQGSLVLIFLLCTMLYSVPETNMIFISTSIYTWFTNMLIVVYLQYILREDNNLS